MERKPEVDQAQALHLLSPTVSDISESSVATVVNSPFPRHFHQGFGNEPSSDCAAQGKDASTVHLLIDDHATGSEATRTDSREGSLHYVSAPPKHEENGNAWPSDASRKSHMFPSLAVPNGPEKAQYNCLEVNKEPNSSFKSLAPDVIRKGRKHIFSIIILVISLYSTVMSGLWLTVAARRPHWGQRISSHGMIKPDNASFVSTLLAKTIEISFSAAFVAFLGQKLSHRAFYNPSRGISIAEMSLRAWVVQPGSMISHLNILRSGILSWLGLATFFVAWLALLYTSASDALISPRLLPGAAVNRPLYGSVSTSFANIEYMRSQCQTPVTTKIDPENSASTCESVEQAGQGNHHFAQYLLEWANYAVHGNGSSDLRYRPRVPAMLYDNTTVKGSWVDIWNMTERANRYGRNVNNVSLAFPHPGVATAAQDTRNKILQPVELSGQGRYSINATVTSPTVNVLCADLSDEELSPMVYSRWPSVANSKHHSMIWPAGIPSYPNWLNSTAVDDLFGFGERYMRRPPVFETIPPPYNTIMNHTGVTPDSIYLLATAADNSSMLCSLRMTISVNCSTIYQASVSCGSLESHCEDSNDRNSYLRFFPGAPSGIIVSDWSSVATNWGLTMALNDGLTGGNASVARLLTQFIPAKSSLDNSMPSIAEALAALAGSTLLLSAQGAPFVHDWNYTTPVIAPVLQGFNATVKAYEYQSRYGQEWQQVFYIVLAGTFIINCYCFLYLVRYSNFLLDITEPENLFDMGFSSLPSKGAEEAFVAAPQKDRYGRKWAVKVDQDHHVHFESVTQSKSSEYGDQDSFTEG